MATCRWSMDAYGIYQSFTRVMFDRLVKMGFKGICFNGF